MVRYPSQNDSSGWTWLFFPELRDYELHWEMAFCDPYPDGPPVGNVMKIRYACDEDFTPVNPFIVKVVPCQAAGGHSAAAFVIVRAQMRHSKAAQQDLLWCSSRLKHVRNGLRTCAEMTTYVTRGMIKQVCCEVLVSAVREWDVSDLVASDVFGDFIERWFEREKVRLARWFRKKGMRQASTSSAAN